MIRLVFSSKFTSPWFCVILQFEEPPDEGDTDDDFNEFPQSVDEGYTLVDSSVEGEQNPSMRDFGAFAGEGGKMSENDSADSMDTIQMPSVIILVCMSVASMRMFLIKMLLLLLLSQLMSLISFKQATQFKMMCHLFSVEGCFS